MKQNTSHEIAGLAAAYVGGMLMVVVGLQAPSLLGFKRDLNPLSSQAAYLNSELTDWQRKCLDHLDLAGCSDGQVPQSTSQGIAPQDANREALPNLLENGSFESPVLDSPARLVSDGTAGLGWRVAWVTRGSAQLTTVPSLELWSSSTFTARDGRQFAKLDSGPASLVQLSQSVFISPGSYKLTFWYAAEPGTGKTDNVLNVVWNGETVDTVVLDGTNDTDVVWRRYVYVVESLEGTNTLSFTAGGKQNNRGVFLDNVSLTKE